MIHRKSVHPRRFALICASVLALHCSCSNYVNIPRSEWANIDPAVAANWEIRTADTRYIVQRFAVTDSTIVLTEASLIDNLDVRHKVRITRHLMEDDLPIVISIDRVASIDRIDFSADKTGFAALLVTAGCGLTALVAYAVVTALSDLN